MRSSIGCAVGLLGVGFTCMGCGLFPRGFLRQVAEGVRAGTVELAGAQLCEKAKTRYPLGDRPGEFRIEQCRSEQQPSGDLRLHLSGSGWFSAAMDVVRADFELPMSVDYGLCLAPGGYLYLIPSSYHVGKPTLRNASFVAETVERRGVLSNSIGQQVADKLAQPRTVIPQLEGRMCVVKGWIPPGSIPIECEGSDTEPGFLPTGGNTTPLVRSPWPAGQCGSGGVEVTGTLLAPPVAAETASSWESRAQANTTAVLRGEYGPSIAARILAMTHPSGKDATIGEIQFLPEDGGLIVTFQVMWLGALEVGQYVTTIGWRLRPGAHGGAAVIADSALVGARGAAELNTYMEEEVYPLLSLE